jgi:hypothetical protein
MDLLVHARNSSSTTPTVVTNAGTTSADAFGRTRISAPFTLFDSSHRYSDNDLWATNTASGGTTAFSATEGLVNLSVTTASGSTVQRETTKVFSYQPGKSLLNLNTFVMAAPQTNLTQRIGYYGADNGFYLEQVGTTINFVERSLVTGTETRIPKTSWNVDKLDGSGTSGLTLDLTKAQILWMDMEWLGLGTVRMGFVINGQMIHCHSFHHANLITSTYITTASLPLRYEIFTTGVTASAATLKQVCSTVLSEGGYELRGDQKSISTSVIVPIALPTNGTNAPVISIRLKTSPNRLDAIVIPTAISLLPTTSDNFKWELLARSTTTGGTWVSAGTNSSVDYNITATGVSGGRVLANGFATASNQGSAAISVLKQALFQFQLERQFFTSTPYELVLACSSSGNPTAGRVLASIDFEEVTR